MKVKLYHLYIKEDGNERIYGKSSCIEYMEELINDFIFCYPYREVSFRIEVIIKEKESR